MEHGSRSVPSIDDRALLWQHKNNTGVELNDDGQWLISKCTGNIDMSLKKKDIMLFTLSIVSY